jgi:hypothetical protein
MIIATTGQGLTVRAKRHCPNAIQVTLERSLAFPSLGIPQLNAIVTTGTGKDRFVGMKS